MFDRADTDVVIVNRGNRSTKAKLRACVINGFVRERERNAGTEIGAETLPKSKRTVLRLQGKRQGTFSFGDATTLRGMDLIMRTELKQKPTGDVCGLHSFRKRTRQLTSTGSLTLNSPIFPNPGPSTTSERSRASSIGFVKAWIVSCARQRLNHTWGPVGDRADYSNAKENTTLKKRATMKTEIN